MRKEYRRLFSLNLALLMLLTVMGPLSGPAAKASDDTVYTINGQSYTGDGSGKGWTYENNILTLEDYNGGAIDFPVGVTIQVSGACTVTAAEGAGISATLVEIKFLPGASLRVQGGSGSPAVVATVNWLGIRLPGELTAISGGSGVPALRAGTNIKIGGASGNVNENVTLEAGGDEQSLAAVTAYNGQACVRAACDQVVLRFDPNGGTIDGETGVRTTKVSYGTVTAFLPQAEKEGYCLRSWKTNSQAYHLKDSFLPGDIEVTFTAQWSSLPTEDYLLFVDGYHDTYTRTYSSDGTMTIPSDFTMDGMTFLGWSMDAGFTPGGTVTELYWPGETISGIPSETVLYGVYGEGTDYLTYAGNGGITAGGSGYAAVRGDTVLGISDLFTWEGHRPQDWNTKADGSGTAFRAGDSLEELGTYRTLYAQWLTLYDRTVVYHGNGGSTADGSVELSVDAEAATLEDQGFQRTDKVFDGWSLTPDGPALTELPAVPSGGTLELYAVWGGYTVTCYGTKWVPYHLEEETYVMAVKPGEAVELPYQYDGSGMYFNGWNTERDGTGAWYQGVSNGPYDIANSYYQQYYTFVPEGDVTLYAQYIDLSDSSDALLFVTEGYYGGQNFLRVPTEDGKLTLPDSLEGYTLLGWTGNEDFGHYDGDACLAGGETAGAAGKVFLAVCEEQTFTGNWINHYVLYDGNGGTTADGAETVFLTVTNTDLVDFGFRLYQREPDEGVSELFRCPMARDGYTLTGWNTEPDGSGMAYDLGTPFTDYFRAGVYGYVFYAQWTPSANAVVTVPDNMRSGGKVFLAFYSEGGQLLGTYTGPKNGFFQLEDGFPAGTAWYRMFNLDSGGAPLTDCTPKAFPVSRNPDS